MVLPCVVGEHQCIWVNYFGPVQEGSPRGCNCRAGSPRSVRAPHVVSYSSAITTACGDSGQWEQALSLVSEMQTESVLAPDVMSYNLAITPCGKGGERREAVTIFF